MDLNSLHNEVGARKDSKRRGRGRASGLGKTAGHGHKGMYARKGHKHKDAFEGGQMPLLRRLPKRGFKNPARVPFFAVNVADLAKSFQDGATVLPEDIVKAGLADSLKIKILGQGDIAIKLTVKGCAFSASAKDKITAAGGTVESI